MAIAARRLSRQGAYRRRIVIRSPKNPGDPGKIACASMRAPLITFLSDYGLDDEFVGVCHGVIARIAARTRG